MHSLRTIGAASVAAGLLLSAGIAFAEERGQTMMGVQGEIEKGDYRMMSASTTERMQKVRDEMHSRVENENEKVSERMHDIQDKVKKDMAEKIAGQFENQNTTWTDKFMNLLDRYDAVLVKIQSRAAIAATNGKDIASTTTAVLAAQAAILTARTAVVAQAAKTYALDPSTIPSTAISTPNGQEKMMKSLRASFQALHKTLFKDLFALRDGPMKDAKKAVQNALQSLGKVPGVDDEHANTTTTKKSND